MSRRKFNIHTHAIVIFLSWLFLCCQAFAQISPGPLSQAHTQLEGITKCLACHEVGKQTSNVKCLTCHVAINGRLQAQRGLHAAIMAKEKNKPCASCHSEHNGLNFALIFWKDGEANFDHQQTGYTLDGKHTKVACRDCHQPQNVHEKFNSDTSVRLPKTFLGLSQECLGCHADEHRGQLNKACEACHDFAGWKPAEKFSHDRAKFLLTGQHKKVPCVRCHSEQTAREKLKHETVAVFVQYTGLSFTNCIPCHQDPHHGGFGNDCVKCHTTKAWNIVATGAFNHDLTAFPLRGKHRSVSCEGCHVSGDFKKKLAHQFCRDCHRDAHAGQFVQRRGGDGCEQCHNVEGFTPSQFTLAEHQTSAFPLAGSHLAVPCGGCHIRQTTGKFTGKLLFVFADRRCEFCHQDVHFGQFAERMTRGSCEICHRNETWRQTTFNHNTARFTLVGAHQKVACGKCHPEEKNSESQNSTSSDGIFISKDRANASTAFTRYRPLAFRCIDCHNDIHRGQFGKKEKARCENCHQPTMWGELLFVHNRDSVFRLEGAHAKALCEKCHFPLQLKGQTFVVIYKPMRKECEACHR